MSPSRATDAGNTMRFQVPFIGRGSINVWVSELNCIYSILAAKYWHQVVPMPTVIYETSIKM